MAKGRVSTYFPSPPESTEPPIVIAEPKEAEELKPERKTELEPEPESEPELEPELEPEHELHGEREPGAGHDHEAVPASPVEPLEPVALTDLERTASYQWPSNTGGPNNGSKLDEVCSTMSRRGVVCCRH